MKSRFVIVLTVAGYIAATCPSQAGYFTPLSPAPKPKIVASSGPYPNSDHVAGNLIDGNPNTEFISDGSGTNTFVEFDFGAPVRIGGIRHQDRSGPATIAESELVFSDGAGTSLATAQVTHVNQSSGITTFALPQPVTAQRVRWQVTKLGSFYLILGGAELAFFAAGESEPSPSRISIAAKTVQIIERKDGKLVQPLKVTIDYPYLEPLEATVRVDGQKPRQVNLKFGSQTLDYSVEALDTERTLNIAIENFASRAIVLKPARKLTVYMLPHSHTDVGFTALQTDIEEKQVNNLLQGIAEARRTANYPQGARFVWNVETIWAADKLLKRLAPDQRADFFDAVKHGQVALNGAYLNELTGLCRPEELIRVFRCATQMGELTGVPVDAAMISDVPGCTWGTVTALAQAGIRYFSVAPNDFDRIGTIMTAWENKPFWWIGPDGRSKVLVWVPTHGYGLSHHYSGISYQLVEDYCNGLDKGDYPYDISYIRWAGHGDNAEPDPSICDFVKEWNSTHVWPQFIISGTSEAFRAFEKRYGDKIPQVRGDWTPYWEDGAGSAAAETAMNRANSDRLTQAEALWAMLAPKHYPLKKFEDAWDNVLLYSEHTFDAFCSITEPANPFTVDLWNIKQSFATAANLQSRQLVSEAVQCGAGFQPATSATQVDIYNTTSWPRTEVVLLPFNSDRVGNFVTDDLGRPVPSQELANHQLAVLVRDLPPFAGRRYTMTKSGTNAFLTDAKVAASGAVIDNGLVSVRIDERTGGIVEMRAKGIDTNLADNSNGNGINDYLYLVGNDLTALQRSGPVKITVRDNGLLVASLLIESDAPGCHKLTREIRVFAGGDYVELINTVDKKRLEAKSYIAKDGKESVNFAFPFNVPSGEVRLDLPLAVMQPELDQIPGACKNWLTVGRWADVANRDFGVTLVTQDTPLVQIGGITATLLNSQTDPDVWRKKIEPSQKLYVWAMNNHWGTNFRPYQEGLTFFRFVLRPHRGPADDAAATRFATGFSQPLVTVPGRGAPPCQTPLLRVEPADVLVTGLKPSDDGKAWILRLYGATAMPATAKLVWRDPAPKRLWLSDTSEQPLHKLSHDIPVPAWGLVTLRADLPE